MTATVKLQTRSANSVQQQESEIDLPATIRVTVSTGPNTKTIIQLRIGPDGLVEITKGSDDVR